MSFEEMINDSKKAYPLPSYVSKADGDLILVEPHNAQDTGCLIALGFSLVGSGQIGVLELLVATDAIKANVFSKLRDQGFAFARGKEWSPAEVFEWLRDEGMLKGPFQSIAWQGPGQWILRNEP